MPYHSSHTPVTLSIKFSVPPQRFVTEFTQSGIFICKMKEYGIIVCQSKVIKFRMVRVIHIRITLTALTV